MKTLVTGGAGFIGSHLVDLLIARHHDVAVIDNLATGKREYCNAKAHFYQMDLADQEAAEVIAEEHPEVLFHLAAQVSVKRSTDDPLYDARVNVLGLIATLRACVRAGVRKIVFASSGATYGNPIYLPIDEDHPQRPASPYGITKMVAEHYLSYFALDHGLSYTCLRYGNVYGPRQDSTGEAGVVAIFARRLLSGEAPLIHWDGEQVRDYVYVTDVARANLLAASAGDNRCYCIGTGTGTSVNRLYEAMCEVTGVYLSPERVPRRPGDLRTAIFDASRARRELDWQPRVSLEDGLRETVAFYRNQPRGVQSIVAKV